jgi:hypothetical protein
MKERSILFSAPMVRAILEGRKTQTRRIIKPQPCNPETFGISPIWGQGVSYNSDHLGRYVLHAAFNEGGKRVDRYLSCPYGRPGDRLWVRETWGRFQSLPNFPVEYRADYDEKNDLDVAGVDRWRPSIHMPRSASRINLEVTAVRVERLQEITEEDAKAEGAVFRDFGKDKYGQQRQGWTMEPPAPDYEHCLNSARFAFANLINKINGPETWDANPWVWVIEFKRVQP